MPRELVGFLTCVACAALIIVSPAVGAGVPMFDKVQAAPPTVPDNCTEIAVIGTIHTYLCQPNDSPPFYINSLGFMLSAE